MDESLGVIGDGEDEGESKASGAGPPGDDVEMPMVDVRAGDDCQKSAVELRTMSL